MNKLATLILAAAGGFVAGVLLAPKSGEETRKELKQKAESYKGKAQEGYEEAKKGALLVKDEVAEGVEVFKQEVGKRAQTIKSDVRSTADEVKKSVK